jgi:hypothetical protein
MIRFRFRQLRKRLVACFLFVILVSLPIRETLTFRAFQRERRTFPSFTLRVFHLKSYSAR